MSFFVWCEIVCNDCADAAEGRNVSGTIPRREMKRDAVRAGWVFDDAGNAKCPRCAAGLPGPDYPGFVMSK